MNIQVSTITRPIISKLIALQTFFFERPRIDLDLANNPEDLYGQRSLGVSSKQDHPEPIPIPFALHNFEFYWNYKLRIKNNSSKTAYNIKLEKITNTQTNYLEKIDEIVSLKDGELIELDYKLRYVSSKNVEQARQFLNSFPGYLDQIEIIVSYTNESRKIFYTKFIATKNSKTNEHLLRRPK